MTVLNPPKSGFLPAWLLEFRAIAVALLTRGGTMVEANQGFLSVLGDLPADSAGAIFVDPPFFGLLKKEPDENGSIHQGLVTLGTQTGMRRTFYGNVYVRNQMILLVAEMDITSFQLMSDEIEKLTSELKDVKTQLSHRSETLYKVLEEMEGLRVNDTLTGLPLRSKLDIQLASEIQRWERYRHPLSLIILSVDGFRHINEEYGRATGDEILTHVATLITDSVRSLDVVVRYGGVEFAVLLPETNEMGAVIAAERLRMDLEELIILPMTEPVTVSVGIASLLPDEKATEFCLRAERAAKSSKEKGKNNLTIAGVVGECDHIYPSAISDRKDADDV